MTSRAVNTCWARTFVDALFAAGVREVVMAPGSRSTPLIMAVARHGGFRMHVQLDERSAGFFALGLGKGSGVPAAVITTSGTATANLYPAVVEAAQSEAPLLLLTADRPRRLRGSDANQAIDQVGLYAGYPRWQADLPEPSADAKALADLRAACRRAVSMAVGVPAGPVHLNFPFDKPLEPELGSAGREPAAVVGTAGSAAEVQPTVQATLRSASPAERDLVAALLASSERPLLVAGPDPREREAGSTLRETATRLGIPLLADPLSGARGGAPADAPSRPPPDALSSPSADAPDEGGTVAVHYDGVLRDPEVVDALTPDLILRLGSAPTSAPLLAALQSWGAVRQVVLDPGDRHRDHLRLADDYLNVDGHGLLADLASAAGLDSPAGAGEEAGAGAGARGDWMARWAAVEDAARNAAATLPDDFIEGWVGRESVAGPPAGGLLFVSSSMPIRDVDAFGGSPASGTRILGNRGASGIDGVVSTALGAAAAEGRPTVALLGDLALFHDSNGLLAARDMESPVVLVVVHNDGGGIFHRLPIAEFEPEFTPLFATPHGLDFGHLAALHGLPYRVAVTREELSAGITEGLSQGGVSVIVVPAHREAGHEARLRAEAEMAAAARRALGLRPGRPSIESE